MQDSFSLQPNLFLRQWINHKQNLIVYKLIRAVASRILKIFSIVKIDWLVGSYILIRKSENIDEAKGAVNMMFRASVLNALSGAKKKKKESS